MFYQEDCSDKPKRSHWRPLLYSHLIYSSTAHQETYHCYQFHAL